MISISPKNLRLQLEVSCDKKPWLFAVNVGDYTTQIFIYIDYDKTIWANGSKLPLCPYKIGDGHQPNSRGFVYPV